MINPQYLDISTLHWLPLDARSAFPRNPAIYFAIDGQGTIQYIGRTVDPKQRWANHHRYKDLASLNGVKIAYLFIDAPELLGEIEVALIEWFQPPLNAIHVSQNNSSNKIYFIATGFINRRKEKGLTQKQVADAVGVTVQTVSNWETGLSQPKLTPCQYARLCKILDSSPDELSRIFAKNNCCE